MTADSLTEVDVGILADMVVVKVQLVVWCFSVVG